MNQIEALQEAILARADRLATEFREQTQRSHDNILRESAERLRLREQREEAIGRALGERHFRQQVQANELKLQAQLDQVRWNLVQRVEERLEDRFQTFTADDAKYLPFLSTLLARAAKQIECDTLVVEVNAHDLARLRPIWSEFSRQAAADKSLSLADEPLPILGGLVVRSTDNRIRVDQSFEGRRERLRHRLYQAILERLLPSSLDTGTLFTG